MPLLYGTDPEVFAVYKDVNNDLGDEVLQDEQFVASPAVLMKFHGVEPVGGDMKHPVMIETNEYKWIMDGAAFELNLKKPQTSPLSMWDVVNTSIVNLTEWLSKYNLEVRKKPVVNFDYKKWYTDELRDDERFIQGIIFGCDPDQDAFNVDWLCRVIDNSRHPLRYGGGHIHLSGVDVFEKYPIPAVKLLALTVGNYCISQSPFPDLEIKRAKYYGKPGKYRVQHYKEGDGIEYRTPSNSWLSYTKEQYENIFKWVDTAIYLLSNPTVGKKLLDEYESKTVTAITTANQKLAQEILGAL